MEEVAHPEKVESFATMHRSTTIPIAEVMMSRFMLLIRRGVL